MNICVYLACFVEKKVSFCFFLFGIYCFKFFVHLFIEAVGRTRNWKSYISYFLFSTNICRYV